MKYIIFHYESLTAMGKQEDFLEDTDRPPVLKEPRIFAQIKDPAGRMVLALQPLLGSPSKLKVPKTALFYTAEDQTLIADYIKSTTGLHLSSKLPNLN